MRGEMRCGVARGEGRVGGADPAALGWGAGWGGAARGSAGIAVGRSVALWGAVGRGEVHR